MCKNYLEVFVDCPLAVCEARDPKGLYKKVRTGEIKSFTGIHDDAPYEQPTDYDLKVETYKETLKQSTNKVIKLLRQCKVL